MPRQFANVMVLGRVAIGVAGLMLSTLSAIGAEGVSYAERIGLIALWAAVFFALGGVYYVTVLVTISIAFLLPVRRKSG